MATSSEVPRPLSQKCLEQMAEAKRLGDLAVNLNNHKYQFSDGRFYCGLALVMLIGVIYGVYHPGTTNFALPLLMAIAFAVTGLRHFSRGREMLSDVKRRVPEGEDPKNYLAREALSFQKRFELDQLKK